MADQTERQSSSRRLAASGTRLPRTGEQVGQYTIQQELGRGTMGAVYRASDPAGREVALKLLTPENQDPVGLLRFQREGRILAALPAHQNVLRIHAMGVHGTLPWLALDLIEGQSLEDRLAAGSLSLRESVALVRTLCLAVDHVHRAGVLHRDLKAANVLLRKEDGEPVLTDFGLALLEGTEGLTRTGDLLGTPLYMAPEQVLGIRKEIDAQTDVWSLGVILYRAVTGGYPFQAGNLSELARMVNHDEWTPLVTRLGRDDPALSLVIGRALAKRKLARYRSARDMAADLAAWPGMPTSRAPEAAAWVRRATVLLGLLAGVLGVTLVAVLLARPLPAPPATAGALPRFDLSGADDGPSRLALEQLRRATRDPGDAAGQLLLAAEADRLARVPDLPGAAAIVSQLAAGPTRDLLAARLALLGGTPPNEGALVLLLDSQDDPTAAAARVLLARACRVADPARAVSLLASRVPPATRVAEEEVARALLAADQLDPRLLVETPPRLRAEVGARLRFALGRALDEGAAGLPRVEALLRSHAALGLRPVADPLADRVLDLLLPAPGPKVGLSLPISTSTRVWVDLGASGLRPTWRRRAEHCLDLLVFAMETGFDHALAVLTAAVQLDVDVTVTHLHLLTQLSMGRTASFGDGWVGEYLSLVDDTEAEGKVRKEQDQIQAEARAKLLAGLRAGRFELGPVNRARALVQSVHVQMPPETAIAVMQEALALDPGNPWATIQLAQALTVHGEKAEGARLALLGARRMEELHGDRPGISWQRAIMLRGAIDLLCNIDRVEEARALLPLIEAMEVPDSHRRAREDVEDAEARLGLRPPRPR